MSSVFAFPALRRRKLVHILHINFIIITCGRIMKAEADK